jgi:hypothetical protein
LIQTIDNAKSTKWHIYRTDAEFKSSDRTMQYSLINLNVVSCFLVAETVLVCKDTYTYVLPQTYEMVYGCTRKRVSIDGEYSGRIFHTDLNVVPGDLYTMTLTRPRGTCRRYIIPLSRRRPPALPKPVNKRNEGKETKNETIILRTQSYEPISPTTDRNAQWRAFGRFSARGNSTSIGRW